MTNLELQIESWHERKFGKTVNVPKTYRKLLEEVGELGEALMRQDPDAIREEAGDVAFVLCHIIRSCCPDKPSLSHAIAVALDKNESRITGKRTASRNPKEAARG